MAALRQGVSAGLAALALALGGCSAFEGATAGANQGIASLGERFGAPWGGMVPAEPADAGRTVARVRAGTPPDGPLEPEPGNVWPAEEAPRATLANPDAALRGIPEYSGPAGLPQPGGARDGIPRDPGVPVQPRPARGTSGPPLPPNPEPRPTAQIPPAPPPIIPAPDRTRGQILNTQQGPTVTTGGTTRSQSTLGPDGRPGVAQSSGGVTTVFGSDGTIQQVPTPR